MKKLCHYAISPKLYEVASTLILAFILVLQNYAFDDAFLFNIAFIFMHGIFELSNFL